MKIELLMRNNPLGMDDKFNFRCRGCGDCCEDVDVLLTPLDIIRACKHLEMEPIEFTEELCEFLIGRQTKAPLFKLACDPDSGRCMLYDGEEGCTIHPVKPLSCAMYPLARGLDEYGKFVYFRTGETCGTRGRRQTVREWLEVNGLGDSEDFSLYWRREAGEVEELLRKFWERESPRDMMMGLYQTARDLLYVEYDVSQEPLAQIAENIEALKVGLADLLEEG